MFKKEHNTRHNRIGDYNNDDGELSINNISGSRSNINNELLANNINDNNIVITVIILLLV